MERRQDSTSAPPSGDAVEASEGEGAGEDTSTGVLERYFRVILVAAIGVAAAGGGAVAYLQYEWLVQQARALPVVGETSSASGGGDQSNKTFGTFTEVEGLIVNPADSGGSRYLAVSLAFETSSSGVVDEIKEKEVVVRDAVLDLLSERTSAELTAPARRDTLKQMLRDRTNRLLQSGTVDRLYFTQFVLQ